MAANRLARFLNNNWVVGLSTTSVAIAVTGMSETAEAVLRTGAGVIAGASQWLLVAGVILFPIAAYVRLRSWITIPLAGEEMWFRCSPVLQLVSWWRGRSFGRNDLADSMNFFASEWGPSYTVEPPPQWCRRPHHIEGRPLVVLRLPARSYLAIPDFINLHLLRRLSIAGARVAVLVMDIEPLPGQAARAEDAERTTARCRRVLGAHTNIARMSSVLANAPEPLAKYLLGAFVQHLTNNPSALTEVSRPSEADPSKFRRGAGFVLFGLVLFALRRIEHSGSGLFVLQWRERLGKWSEFGPTPAPSDLYIEGLVVSDSLKDYNGKAVLTGSHRSGGILFAMTDDAGEVARKLLAGLRVGNDVGWEIPGAYVAFLGKVVLGVESGSTASHIGRIFKLIDK